MNSIEQAKTKKLFESILESNEKLIWIEKPRFEIFLCTGIPFLLIGLLWGAIDYSFIKAAMNGNNSEQFSGYLLPFVLLHLAPCYLSILNMLRLVLVYKNACYAFTDKRLLIRGGFFGIDFKSVDFDKIQDLEVNVNPIEKMLGVGTIKAQTATVGYNNRPVSHKFVGVSAPYETFKKIKEVSTSSKENTLLV